MNATKRRHMAASILAVLLVAGSLTAGMPAAVEAESPSDTAATGASMSSDTPILGVAVVDLEVVCVILAVDGTLRCWQDNFWSSEPAPRPPPGPFTAVTTDGFALCALRADRTVACWSYSEDVPTSPEGTFSAVDGACGVRTDQTIACWRLEDGVTVTTVPLEGTFSAISWPCAIRTDATLACWAGPDMGDPPDGTFTALSTGPDFACAIRTDDTLACWGDEFDGQTDPPAGTFSALSSGTWSSCAIRTGDGTLACWGGGLDAYPAPGGGPFTAVSVGTDGGCAIRPDRTFQCWGTAPWPPRPTALLTRLGPWQRSVQIRLSWSSIPALADVTSYDVRFRSAPWNGSLGAWTTWRTGLTVTSKSFKGSPGRRYCFEARAHDRAGRVSDWTNRTCTAIPLDDRSLNRSTGWSPLTGARFYRSTALVTRRQGARLTTDGVKAGNIALLATTCPTCGTVRVYWGKRLLREISLVSATREDRVLIGVIPNDQGIWGTSRLRIKVVSSGKTVIIDGLAIR